MTSKDAKHAAPVDSLEGDVHTIEKRITGRVRSEVYNLMATDEARVHDAKLTALQGIVITRVELAMKSVNASPGRDIDIVVPDPNQIDFSGNMEALQMTASSRMNSNTELNKVDVTCSIVTVEVVDLSVNERNFDRHTHTYHRFAIHFQISV